MGDFIIMGNRKHLPSIFKPQPSPSILQNHGMQTTILDNFVQKYGQNCIRKFPSQWILSHPCVYVGAHASGYVLVHALDKHKTEILRRYGVNFCFDYKLQHSFICIVFLLWCCFCYLFELLFVQWCLINLTLFSKVMRIVLRTLWRLSATSCLKLVAQVQLEYLEHRSHL